MNEKIVKYFLFNRSAASLVTFALGIETAFVWLDHSKLANDEARILLPAQQIDLSTEQPILAYCELANNPEK